MYKIRCFLFVYNNSCIYYKQYMLYITILVYITNNICKNKILEKNNDDVFLIYTEKKHWLN